MNYLDRTNLFFIACFLSCVTSFALDGQIPDITPLVEPCSCEKSSSVLQCDCYGTSTAVDLQNVVTDTLEDLVFINTDLAEVSTSRAPDNHKLKSFSCILCNITGVAAANAFAFPTLENLDLSHNQISKVAFVELLDFKSLKVVNLSHNIIEEVASFRGIVTTVQNLDLSHNLLTTISRQDTFSSLPNLQQLDLSYNRLTFVVPGLFAQLVSLTVLNLQNNSMSSLNKDVITNSRLRHVELGGNPWNCHAGLEWMTRAVSSRDGEVTMSGDVRCSQPDRLLGKLLTSVDASSLTGSEPEIDLEPSNKEEVVWHSFFLHCNATGTPTPSVYWHGPRGFLVHPDNQHFLPSDVTEYDVKQKFTGQPRIESSKVEILRSGSLKFTRFRYNYAGEYTCIAINPMGSSNVTVQVSVRTMVYESAVWSVVFGAFVSAVFLVVSVVVGLVRLLVRRVRKHLRDKNMAIDDPYEDEAEFWDEYFRHPLDTGRQTPEHFPSPVKCITPAEPTKSEMSDVNGGISSTLESVRTRLGASMGRHMDQMRTRANHMRDTGRTLRIDVNKKVERMRYKAYLMRESAGMRMINLRESSSATLRNMREGVAGRYEAVKYQVRSIREFCGSANMPHTVSVPSISTNVDSEEREEVFKTVTFC